MFSVKGWNITAPVKRQLVPPPTPKQGAADSVKPSKKRKRADEQARARSEHDSVNGETQRAGNEFPARDGTDITETARSSSQHKSKDRSNRSHPTDTTRPSQSIVAQAGDDAEPGTTKKKSKRDRKRDKKDTTESTGENGEKASDAANPLSATVAKIASSLPAKPPPAPSNLTPLQEAMRAKLVSSRFRYLNETLYTTRSADSLELFTTNPDFFNEYHEGFARQVESWPENPVDGFAALLVARGNLLSKGFTPGKMKGGSNNGPADVAQVRASAEKLASTAAGRSMGANEPLPRDQASRETVVIDLGCGTAALARQLQAFREPLRLRLHSYDLAAPNELITVADIRKLPLIDSSVDVAVFSLALMGTNWIDFVEEAWRVLRWKGECWVADVNSRFAGQAKRRVVEHSVGARVKTGKKGAGGGAPAAKPESLEDEGLVDEEGAQRSQGTDVSAFVAVLQRRGFALVGEPDVSNKMFARMRFTKSLTPSRGKCAKSKEKKWGPPGKKFIDRAKAEDDISIEDEARVLKPCVYKAR